MRNDNSDNRSHRAGQADNAKFDEKTKFADRVAQLLEQRGADMAWLSRETGIAQSSLSDYRKGRVPRVDAAIKIADALKVPVEMLFAPPEAEDEAQFLNVYSVRVEAVLDNGGLEPQAGTAGLDAVVHLPQVDIGYSMGGGAVFDEYLPTEFVPFPREWLRPIIRGRFDEVFVARGEGDSMQPTILDGDMVIVDRSQRTLTSQDRLWCCTYGDLGMIKRLRSTGDGILVLSDNNLAVTPFTAHDDELHIIGRVVFVIRRV